jgi:hypothetical protein
MLPNTGLVDMKSFQLLRSYLARDDFQFWEGQGLDRGLLQKDVKWGAMERITS